MAGAKDIKTIQERNIKALKLRPSIGQGTATTTVRVRSGVTCDIEDGGWKLVADEMPGDGGAGLGPDPGVLGRAGLGSCLAMGYVHVGGHARRPARQRRGDGRGRTTTPAACSAWTTACRRAGRASATRR